MNDGKPGEAKPLVPREAPACQVCGEPLHGRAVVECCQCGTPHHLSCWRFNKRCSIYGCGSRSCRQPAPSPALKSVGPFEVKVNPRYRSFTPLDAISFTTVVGIAGLMMLLGLPVDGVVGPTALLLIPVLIALLAGIDERLSVDPTRGTIDRSLRIRGRTVWSVPDWLRFSRVVELHVHRWTLDGIRPTQMWQLQALLDDGSRTKILTDSHPGGQGEPELPRIAEQLAEMVDCTVRRFDGAEPPDRAELDEAVTAWRDSRALPAAPEAAGPDAPAGSGTPVREIVSPSADGEPTTAREGDSGTDAERR